ncbi:MAG: alpha/beta hydrolase [Bacillota bacterium]|nr:alpha/beta hydrolase [Bacillota bacterium]
MLIAIIILLCIILYITADAYRYIFLRRRPKLLALLLDKRMHGGNYYENRDRAAEELRSCPCTVYEMSSLRGEKLKGFYYPCGEGKSKKIAFIVHGYRSDNAETAGVFRQLYHSRGFDIFAPDNTACGESGGNACGYDVFESADALKWLDFLQAEFGEDIEIILHGISLGGASVMKISDRLPQCVKFVVEDSGFIDGRELLKAQTGPLYGLMAGLHRLIYRCDLKDSDVRDNLKRSAVPFLFVHGEEDNMVPFSMAPRALECHPGPKDFLFTPNIKHIETVHYNRAAYEEKLDSFIEKYI